MMRFQAQENNLQHSEFSVDFHAGIRYHSSMLYAKENQGTDRAAHAVYHPDCPACLRGRPHTTEHEAKLRQVYAASVDRSGERRRELAMADAYEGTCD